MKRETPGARSPGASPPQDLSSEQPHQTPDLTGAITHITASLPSAGGKTHPASTTDVGNVDLMVALNRARLRYCPETGRWLTWNGTRWRDSPADGAAYTAARQSIDAITLGLSKDMDNHVMRSMNRPALAAMVALAQRDPRMCVDLDELDAHAHMLNTPDGIVDLSTRECHRHDPSQWHTKQTGAGYDPRMPTPQWDQFLDTTFGGDAELIGYVQRLAGYAACGVVTEHILPFLFGGGQNGKSCFMDVLSDELGDYAISAPANFLLAGREQHATEIARLRGARLVVCSEINRESKFDEAKVKLLTGGDRLTGRFMHQDYFDFAPAHTLVVHGNHKPEVSAGGTSFWRRLRLVPFGHTMADRDKVDGLARKLVTDEGPGILAWIVAGAAEVLRSGMRAPESVMAATREYSAEEDAIGRFVAECCYVATPGTGPSLLKTVTSAMFARYQRWARAEGVDELNAITLGRELSSKFGIKSHRSNGVSAYQGISLVVDDSSRYGSDEQTA